MPTRGNSPTTWARGKPPSPSPLATSPDSSLDPLLLPSGEKNGSKDSAAVSIFVVILV